MKIQDIPKLTDAELDSYLASGEYHEQGYQFALQEYNRRKLKALSKPHWTVSPNFWFTVIAAVSGVLAVWLGYSQSCNQGHIDGATRAIERRDTTHAAPSSAPEPQATKR